MSLNAIASSSKTTLLKTLRNVNIKNKKRLSKFLDLRRGTLSYKAGGRTGVNLKITPDVAKKIEAFYKSMPISSLMPNKRKTATGDSMYVMQVPLISAYKDFRLAHPEVNIGLISFYKAKPKCVHLLKRMKWLQCICDLCMNVKYILQTIGMSMIRHNFETPEWVPVRNPINFGLQTLCHGTEKYSFKCLQRECSDCGISNVLEDIKL